MSNIDYSNVNYGYPVCKVDEIVSTIEKYGVAVVENILTEEECKIGIDGANRWLESIAKNEEDKIKLSDKNSLRFISQKMHAIHGGLIQHYSVGHSQYVWDIRQNPKVKSVFENIWKEKDLIVSFDGVNITPPPELTNLAWQNPKKHWFHTDQNNKKEGLQSIQGSVVLEDCFVGDATLCVISSSNRFHKEFFQEFKKEMKTDWYKIESDEEVKWFLDKGCQIQAIAAYKGSMILWDSRTFHMGISPQKRRKIARWRYIVYVAMFPRRLISSTYLKKRKEWVKNGRMTNHWGNKLFPTKPQVYGREQYTFYTNAYVEPILTEIGKSLI